MTEFCGIIDQINASLLAKVTKAEILDLFVKRLHPESDERAKLSVHVASQRLPFALIEPALWGIDDEGKGQSAVDLTSQDGADLRELDGNEDGDGAQEYFTMERPLYDDEPNNQFEASR